MAKAEKTKKVEKKATAKAPKAPKGDITFGAWIKTVARARGDAGSFVKTAREDKKFPTAKGKGPYEAKFGSDPAFGVLWSRYESYRMRGSQSKKAPAAAMAA